MNILFFVPYVPNLVRVRPFNLIRQLSEKGHRVSVMTLWSSPQEKESVERLKNYAFEVHAAFLPRWRSILNSLTALPTRAPLQFVYCWQPGLAKRTVELVTGCNGKPEFDVIHVEHLRGARYGLYLKSHIPCPLSRIPVVWDSVDSISLLFRQAATSSESIFSRWLTRFELGRTERYENWLIKQFDHTLVTSSADKNALLSLTHSEINSDAISVVRNGVDLNYFKPDDKITRDPATLIISGKMSYHANVTMVLHFIQNIMPRVWSSREDVKVCIVGKDPPNKIRSLAKDPKIAVTGTVPDIRPYLRQATIAVAPIAYGVGIQNKVLEAMACATPVIATPQAITALDVIPGRDLKIAQEPIDFAEAILDLITDQEPRRSMGENGRLYVERHHQWFAVTSQLEEIYDRVIESNHSSTD